MLEWIVRGALVWIVGWLSLAMAWSGYWLNMLLTTEQGPFEVSIERQVPTERDERLIAAAEAVCPDAALLEECPPMDIAAGDCRWWCEERKGLRIPIGITGAAWQYFQDEIGKMQQEAESHDINRVTSARLHYTAAVRPNITPNPATGVTDVVELSLKWRYFCGGFCGVSFQMEREVHFDAQGNVVKIVGDGHPDIPIY